MRQTVIPAACALLVMCAGCQGDKQAHETADTAHHHHHHHHTAPHGGLLVEIGDHAANLEFVFDTQSGLLTAYVLDGCAENAVRIAQPTIELSVVLQDEPHSVEAALVAVANPLTGETVGDTSQFAAVVPELVGRRFFAAVIGDLEIRGTKTAGVEFRYHDH